MIPIEKIPTPCYVCDESVLEDNAKKLALVQQRTGCKVLLSLKAFSAYYFFPLLRPYLSGANASSLHEARLAFEEFAKEVHVYAPVYKEQEFGEILRYADHISFNSFGQWESFKPAVMANTKPVRCGLRLNPQHSEVRTPLYDPCARYSRLGITKQEFHPEKLDGISGYLMHCLCENNADSLVRALEALEKNFKPFLENAEWINLGGGHHITRSDYDVTLLCQTIERFQQRYKLDIILEPGEAVALNAGYLVASVQDIIHNEMDIAILDASASAHMPDVIEMPYRPQIIGAHEAHVLPHTYRLGGLTCLAGDVIGDYSFETPLKAGDKLIVLDMAHYTMVKNTTFNGVCLPSIGSISKEREFKLLRSFGYEDFKGRLS
ncbi:MAG: carboxynorspermidine decarboxylase [Chlamydiota bacterium]|nr:carboxynorspermidine decarboxylase [Chlamydiota bacterium]